jgi:predicted DNA-binding transcriptional regulator AlpA
MPHPEDDVLIDRKRLCETIGIAESTAAKWKREGKLPPAIKISARCVRWRLSDVKAFIAAKASASPK